MRMGILACIVALSAPLTALAADPPIVFQTTPINKILEDVRSIAKLVGGEKTAERVNNAIKEKLGEKGFEGLDVERPILGYVQISGKIEDVVAVLAIPVTSEKEFLGFYERVFEEKLKPSEKGIYEIKLPKADDNIKLLMRFEAQHAYVAIGKNPASALASNALVPAAQLYDPQEKGMVSLKVHFDRLPKEIREEMANGLKELRSKLDELPLPPEAGESARKAVDELIKLGKRYADFLQDAKTATARVILDVNSGEAAIEIALAGKPGSPLAKSIADRKPSTNKFAGLITPDCVAGLKLQLPLFAPELQNAAVIGLESGQKQAKETVPQAFHAAIDEAFKGLIRTVKDGEFDLAFSVKGPDKDGLYSVVGAVAFEDPSALETELRVLYKTELPEEFKSFINLDVAKAGKTSIHQAKVGGLLPPEVQKIFGDEASVTFAFAPKGIFLAFGPDAVNTLKGALDVKKGTSPAFEILINPKKLGRLLQKTGLELPNESFGSKDMLFSTWAISIDGGKELRLKMSTNLKSMEGAGAFGFPGAAKPQELKKEAKPR